MIKFSSTKLERALANGVLTSWEKTKYLIFIIILYTFSGPIYVLTPPFGPKRPMWHLFGSSISSILIILFTFHGVKKCYQTNKAIDNTDFIERFIALYMPMTFKFIAMGLFAMAAAVLIALAVSPDKETGKTIFIYFLIFVGPVSTYLFYIFLNRSFKRLGILLSARKNLS